MPILWGILVGVVVGVITHRFFCVCGRSDDE
jgi:hypothetical protein